MADKNTAWNIPALKLVLRQLRESTSPDWALSAELVSALGAEAGRHKRMGYAIRYAPFTSWATGAHWCSLPRYMSDLPSAIHLVEDLVPGVWWLIGKGKLTDAEPMYGAQLLFGSETIAEGEHEASPAAALIMALLAWLTS